MPFTILVLFSAFLIETIGTYVSVLGLASLFSANPIIIALAIALDIGKVVSVSFLYKKWNHINLVMRSYMTVAAVVLMIITSAGAFGFLSAEFQKAISGTNTQNVMIQTLQEEQARLQKRKEEIDKQIAQLPENMVRGRTQLMRQFAPEVNRINERIAEIDKELPSLKIDSIKKNVEVGPIIYIAEAFDTTPEKAVKWVIFIIIFVFDPLAIALLLAGNFLLEERNREKNKKESDDSKLNDTDTDTGLSKDDITSDNHLTETNKEGLDVIPAAPSLLEIHTLTTAQPAVEPAVEQKEEMLDEQTTTGELPALSDDSKLQQQDSIEIVIDTSSPPAKSLLEDIIVKDNADIQVDTDHRSNLSKIKSIYQDNI